MRNTIRAKLPGMRKAREWSAMPIEDGRRILVQAEGCIGIFNFRTGEGKLCTRGGYFPHLSIAKPYTFPQDFVRECLRACPSLGGETTLDAGHIVEHTVRVIGDEQ